MMAAAWPPGGGARPQGGSKQFAAGSYPHNLIISAVLLPATLILLGLAGRVVLGVALAGAFVCYILDALRMQARVA